MLLTRGKLPEIEFVTGLLFGGIRAVALEVAITVGTLCGGFPIAEKAVGVGKPMVGGKFSRNNFCCSSMRSCSWIALLSSVFDLKLKEGGLEKLLSID